VSDITVVLGPPAAGKSTWVHQQAQPGDITVDFDAMAKALGSRSDHDHPESVISATFAARGGVVSKALRDDPTLDGVKVYVIHSTPKDEWMDEYRQAGAKFVIIDPGEPLALMRAKFERRPAGTDQRIRDWYANYPDIEEAETVKAGPLQTKKNPEGEIRSKVAFIQTKADDGSALKEGEFIGYAAVFGNIDSYGDKIAQGAFSASLADYQAKGLPIPAYWGHQMSDPMMNIGATKVAQEDDHGLRVHVKLDLDNPNGAQVHKLIKEGRVNQMSFAYEIEEAAWVEEMNDDGTLGDSFFELRKLKIFEVSVVQVGANQATELLDVKSRLEDQRALTSTSARVKLAKAADLIAEAMDEADTQDNTEDTTTDVEEPNADGKDEAQAESETGAEVKSRFTDPKYIRSLIIQKYI